MKYYRNDLILEFCKNKRVLHIGATDSPYHIEKAKENLLLHQKLQTVCNELIGIDKDRNTIKELKGSSLFCMGNSISLLSSETDSCVFG